jgi:DNA polymerase-3 subunit delta
MQLRGDQLSAHLDEIGASLNPVYVIHGDDALLTQEAGDALRQAARFAGYTDRQVHTVSGAHFDWSAVLASAQAMSLFAERQLIEIRIPSGKPGKDGSQALQQYCEALSEDVCTLVFLPRLGREQLGSAWFTALDAAGLSLRIDPVERKDLPAWMARRLAAQGLDVGQGEQAQRILSFLADRVEGNLLAAHQEIQKLALLQPPGPLSWQQVDDAVLNVARYDVFKLSEAVLACQSARAQRMLHGLRASGEAAVLVHWTLAEDLRALWRVKDALQQGKPLPMALREQRVWGLKERLFERVAPRVSSDELAALVHAASVVDGVVKGLRDPAWPHDPWQALERLMAQALACFKPIYASAR